MTTKMKKPPDTNSTLRPIHHSMMGRLRQPNNMTLLVVDNESSRVLEEQALSIFTDMCNAGAPFSKALASILLTGMHWGKELS